MGNRTEPKKSGILGESEIGETGEDAIRRRSSVNIASPPDQRGREGAEAVRCYYNNRSEIIKSAGITTKNSRKFASWLDQSSHDPHLISPSPQEEATNLKGIVTFFSHRLLTKVLKNVLSGFLFANFFQKIK